MRFAPRQTARCARSPRRRSPRRLPAKNDSPPASPAPRRKKSSARQKCRRGAFSVSARARDGSAARRAAANVSQNDAAASSAPSLSVSWPSQSCQRLSRTVAPWTWLRTKREVRADFGIARRQLRGPAIRGDGLAEMAGLEFRVGVIEQQRRRLRAGLENFFVGVRRRRQISLRRKACSPPKNPRSTSAAKSFPAKRSATRQIKTCGSRGNEAQIDCRLPASRLFEPPHVGCHGRYETVFHAFTS